MAAPMARCLCGHQKTFFFSTRATITSSKMCTAQPKQSKKRKKAKEVPSLPPDKMDHDWVGPPDKVSNIRQMRFYIPENETNIEKQYRQRRVAVQQWHHEFWTEHNKRFFAEKEAFIKKTLSEREDPGVKEHEESLTPEEMSMFYQKFLDTNYKTHLQYNKEWYKKNIRLLWPAFLVNIVRLSRWRPRGKKNPSPGT